MDDTNSGYVIVADAVSAYILSDRSHVFTTKPWRYPDIHHPRPLCIDGRAYRMRSRDRVRRRS